MKVIFHQICLEFFIHCLLTKWFRQPTSLLTKIFQQMPPPPSSKFDQKREEKEVEDNGNVRNFVHAPSPLISEYATEYPLLLCFLK